MSDFRNKTPNARFCRRAQALAILGLLLLASGCAVPQPRGGGELTRQVEPTTKRGYWRYLPQAYVAGTEQERASRRWPVVVSFHGMKPFDSAYAQAREWEAEADRYGFIVVAPELRAVSLLGEFPIRHVNPALASDEAATLAILDDLFATTAADRRAVLATSWSSGGYLAHYFLNHYPERFTCLAVRQSNFSESILDESAVGRSRQHPVLIVNTQNDFAICKRESKRAVEWYNTHGYANVAWFWLKGLGHERTPDVAAAFFGRVIGLAPAEPPGALVRRQAIDGASRSPALFPTLSTTGL
ncbi:MAG: PHB depolymerase family esterase [Phycisphaerae bacterium]|jgi:poly(3-hydroxybutyrate) depolymerase